MTHRAVAACLLASCLAAKAAATPAVPQSNACAGNKPLVFGFLPLVSPEKLVQRFAPLVNYLADNIARPVRIETAPDFEYFVDRTINGRRYDLLFTAPHFFHQAYHSAGYRPLVRVDSPGMVAIIAVPRSSEIRNVEGLVGRKLATVHPLGLATLLIRKHLLNQGVDPDRDLDLVSTPSHNASLLSALHGVTDAAALMMPPFRAANPEVQEAMRIIARSEQSPHMPISVAPWVNSDCARYITHTLLAMHESVSGRHALESTRFPGFVRATYEDYAGLAWAVGEISR